MTSAYGEIIRDRMFTLNNHQRSQQSATGNLPKDEETFLYKPQADIILRLKSLSAAYTPGREPNAAAVFLVKGVLDALSAGPTSEKNIKSTVLEQCKALGIKSTTRGTISGLNMEVSLVCNILHALGAIELESPSIPASEEKETIKEEGKQPDVPVELADKEDEEGEEDGDDQDQDQDDHDDENDMDQENEAGSPPPNDLVTTEGEGEGEEGVKEDDREAAVVVVDDITTHTYIDNPAVVELKGKEEEEKDVAVEMQEEEEVVVEEPPSDDVIPQIPADVTPQITADVTLQVEEETAAMEVSQYNNNSGRGSGYPNNTAVEIFGSSSLPPNPTAEISHESSSADQVDTFEGDSVYEFLVMAMDGQSEHTSSLETFSDHLALTEPIHTQPEEGPKEDTIATSSSDGIPVIPEPAIVSSEDINTTTTTTTTAAATTTTTTTTTLLEGTVGDGIEEEEDIHKFSFDVNLLDDGMIPLDGVSQKKGKATPRRKSKKGLSSSRQWQLKEPAPKVLMNPSRLLSRWAEVNYLLQVEKEPSIWTSLWLPLQRT
eukprot:gene31851-41332_t